MSFVHLTDGLIQSKSFLFTSHWSMISLWRASTAAPSETRSSLNEWNWWITGHWRGLNKYRGGQTDGQTDRAEVVACPFAAELLGLWWLRTEGAPSLLLFFGALPSKQVVCRHCSQILPRVPNFALVPLSTSVFLSLSLGEKRERIGYGPTFFTRTSRWAWARVNLRWQSGMPNYQCHSMHEPQWFKRLTACRISFSCPLWDQVYPWRHLC